MKNQIKTYCFTLLLCLVSPLYVIAQQDVDLKQMTRGTVFDEKEQPLSGVKISLLDDFKQVLTNQNGEFIIDIPTGSMLYFKKEGYLPYKQEINERGLNLKVILEPADTEPLYHIGYETRKLSELTTAVSVVNAGILGKQKAVSAENALAGTLAGLTVLRNSGSEPGAELTNLYIRGIGTENAMRSPYILVDDVERSFSQMDIHEIESVTILKDGASNAIYGQRGANGTVLVTTKRGFVGKPEIDFIAQVGTQQPTRLPQYLNSREYLTFYNKALQNDGLVSPNDDRYDPAMYDGSQDPMRYPDVNWYDEFIKSNAFQQQHKLMFRGGTDVVRYFVLLGYLNQQGLYKHTDLNDGYSTNLSNNRFNIRTNLDADVSNSLVVSLDIAGRMENRNMPDSAMNVGSLFSTLSSLVPNAMPVQYNDTMLGGTSQYRKNPLGMISQSGYRQERRIALQIKAKAVQQLDILTKGLNAELAFGYDGVSSYGLFKSRSYATYEMQNDGSFIKYGEDIPLSLNMQPTNKGYSYLLSFYGGLNYNRVFDKHGVSGNVRYYQAQTFIRNNNPPYGKQGFSGRAGYSFDKRYFADFMFSYDGADEFAKGHRFGFFPGVAAGWLISNEQFMQDNDIVSFLKLRASYGEAGNCKTSGLDRYVYQSNWAGFDGASGGYIFGNGFAWSDGAWEGRMPNPYLTWETTRNVNLGVDLSLFDKLSFTIDGFVHNRDNIILELKNTTSSVIGSPYPYANAGSVLNRGFETTLLYADKIDELNFFVQGNISFARNTIMKTDEPGNTPDNLKRTGHSVTQPWGMLASGYYKDQDDIDASPYNALYKVRPGDIKYEDVNKDGIINSQDEIAIGSSLLPEWSFGLTAGAEWKGLDVSFLLSGFAGRSVMLDNSAVWILQNNGNATGLAYGAWEAGVREGDQASYPRLTTEANKNNYRHSTYWQRNGSFLRLNNIEIGYSLPEKIVNNLKMKELRFFVNGQNLFSFDYLRKYDLDPEVLNAGVTEYPLLRTMNVGLSVKF